MKMFLKFIGIIFVGFIALIVFIAIFSDPPTPEEMAKLERAAAEKQLRKKNDRKAEEDIQCWYDKHSSELSVYCSERIENLAKL